MAFKKGQSGNPNGRKKGVPNKRTELMNAIKYVQGTKDPNTKKKRKKLLVHAIEKAYEDNTVLIALLRKLIPDMKEVHHEGELNFIMDLSNRLQKALEQKKNHEQP